MERFNYYALGSEDSWVRISPRSDDPNPSILVFDTFAEARWFRDLNPDDDWDVVGLDHQDLQERAHDLDDNVVLCKRVAEDRHYYPMPISELLQNRELN